MPIITKPNPVVKGASNVFTLSKADLLLNEQVAADVYYSDSDNWNIVKLNYISSSGNQFKEVIFDATQLSPEGIFYASSKSLDVFKIVNLKIYDFDGGSLTVESRSLTVSEFDIDMSIPISSDLIDQSNISSGSVNTMYAVNDVMRQSFQFSSAQTVTSLGLYMSRIDSSTAILGARIKRVSDDAVMGVSTTTVSAASLTGSPALYMFSFSSIVLSASVSYYLEIYFADFGDMTPPKYIQGYGTNSNPYPDGNLSFISNGSFTEFSGWDFGFKVIGY